MKALKLSKISAEVTEIYARNGLTVPQKKLWELCKKKYVRNMLKIQQIKLIII